MLDRTMFPRFYRHPGFARIDERDYHESIVRSLPVHLRFTARCLLGGVKQHECAVASGYSPSMISLHRSAIREHLEAMTCN